MGSNGCTGGDHNFEPGVAVEQWVATGSASAAPAGAARCECGELAITAIESSRDAHWPLWPYYIGQRTTLTNTGLLPKPFRSIVRVALASNPRGTSDLEPPATVQ